MTKKRKLGYYRKNSLSNKELVKLFEANQAKRYQSKASDWEDKEFLSQLYREEKKARKEILSLLRTGKVRTADDFFRAGHFLHHSDNFQDYALAVALFAASRHLGEPWGKNWYAVALDRFLLAVKQPQYFGTQFEKRKGKWELSKYRSDVSDKERQQYDVESLKEAKEAIKELEEADKER